ncbi:TetR/AcrR family transcriptional regulator [Gillisia mitskevichiae]|nr:TetR/AcrR family transcriptional regulator [Gillisia mitskevichiae]
MYRDKVNMPRKKEYIEEEVIEKAMNLFWLNGFENTSMQMLEKEMGINKFSIYSSFVNKNGVFLECVRIYNKKLDLVIDKLKNSTNGILGIKQYFYDFIDFTNISELGKGCLVTNTSNEIGNETDERVKEVLSNFMEDLKKVFIKSLSQDLNKEIAIIQEQADFLIISMFGLSSATRMFKKDQLNNYVENVFKNL